MAKEDYYELLGVGRDDHNGVPDEFADKPAISPHSHPPVSNNGAMGVFVSVLRQKGPSLHK